MGSDCLSILDGTAVLQVGGDASSSKRVAADSVRADAGGPAYLSLLRAAALLPRAVASLSKGPERWKACAPRTLPVVEAAAGRTWPTTESTSVTSGGCAAVWIW